MKNKLKKYLCYLKGHSFHLFGTENRTYTRCERCGFTEEVTK